MLGSKSVKVKLDRDLFDRATIDRTRLPRHDTQKDCVDTFEGILDRQNVVDDRRAGFQHHMCNRPVEHRQNLRHGGFLLRRVNRFAISLAKLAWSIPL